MQETLYDVFISHSSKDNQVAAAIVHHLESLGIRCFLAKDKIPAGANWPGQLTTAIRSSKALVLIVSEDSNKSDPVLKEINLASSSGLHIVQFKVAKVALNPDLEFHLANKHWIDAIDPPEALRIEELGSAMCRLLSIEAKGPFGPGGGGTREPTKTSARWLLGAMGGVALLGMAGLAGYLIQRNVELQKENLALKSGPVSKAPQTITPIVAPAAGPGTNSSEANLAWTAWDKKMVETFESGYSELKLPVFEEGIKLCTAQLRDDPNSENWLYRHGFVQHRYGEYLAGMSKWKESITQYQAGMQLLRKAAALYSTNATIWDQLSMTAMQCGWSQWNDRQVSESETSMREGVAAIEQAIAIDKSSLYHHHAGLAHYALGDIVYLQIGGAKAAGETGRYNQLRADAKEHLGKSRIYMKQIPATVKGDNSARSTLNVASQCLIVALDDGGEFDAAVEVGRENIQLVSEILKQAPSDPIRVIDMARVHGHLSGSLIGAAKFDEARKELAPAAELLGNLERFPQFKETDDFKAVKQYVVYLQGRLSANNR